MLLKARDGSTLEALIIGYQFPSGNDNWLLVSIRIETPWGKGVSVEPCWQTDEVRRMISWLVALAEGRPVDSWGGACLESNLEFEQIADAETVTLRAHFILEHGNWYPVDGEAALADYNGFVDLELARDDLQQAANDLADELANYPPREAERILPSPRL